MGAVAHIGRDSLRESSDVGEAHAKAHASPLSHDELVSLQRLAAQARLAVGVVRLRHGLACGEIRQAGTARDLLGCRDPDLLDAESSLRSPASPGGRAGRGPDPTGRCQARIAVQIPYRAAGQPLNLLIDSTGIKFR